MKQDRDITKCSWLGWLGAILIALAIFLFFSEPAHADEAPIKCRDFKVEQLRADLESGVFYSTGTEFTTFVIKKMITDLECMQKNWRPTAQFSYYKGDYICDFKGNHLRGKGFVRYNIDDKPYIIDIDCPDMPSEAVQK